MTESLPTQERSHTLHWQDPMIGAQAAKTMANGEIPPAPIAVLMNMQPIEVEHGRVVFSANPAEYHYNPIGTVRGGFAATVLDSALGCAVHSALPAGTGYSTAYNPIGTVHGGFAATVLDSALGCAVHSALPAGTGYSTAELHVNYIRPITAKTGELRCEGKVIHAGSRVATAEARLTDSNGKLYAHATTTCIY